MPVLKPAPKSAALTAKTILTDITVALAAVTTVGEAVLAAVPSGPVRTAFQVALPLLTALVAGLRKIGG